MDTQRWALAAMTPIAVIGAFLRVVHINTVPGLNPDEVEVVLQWFRHPVMAWYVAPSGRPHVNPLGPLLLWPFATFASPAPWLVRMPAVLAGLAVLPAVFWMTRRTFGQATAVSATMLTASTPILIAYSRLGWDPAYIPIVVTLAIGLAFERRWAWACSAMALLVAVHPTAAFVLVIVTAPLVCDLWNGCAGSPQRALRRGFLSAACGAACLMLVVAIAAPSNGIPIRPHSVPHVLRLVSARLGDASDMAAFAGGYWQAVQGTLIYTGFIGGHMSGFTLWTVAIVVVSAMGSGALLWRQRRMNELTLLAALVTALVAQYLSQGAEVASTFRERYLLWSAVPSCLVVAFVVQAVCASCAIEKWTPAIVFGLSGIWLTSFYTGYLHPFERYGGESAVLDYRTSGSEPKVATLEAIRRNRRHPESIATVFVGESRLQLALLYLASKDAHLEIKNLGKVLYTYYQRDNHQDLLQAYTASAAATQDLFFVDYEWDRLQGNVRSIHKPVTGSVAVAVAPWTATEVEAVHAVDGRPLLKIWRLSRP